MKRIIEWWKHSAVGGGRGLVIPEGIRRDEDCVNGEWIYSVVAPDEKTQLSLTIRVIPGWETYGKDLTLHTNFKGLTEARLRTVGGFVCETDFETSSLLAAAFVRETTIGKLADPHEQMWRKLEGQWSVLDARARNSYHNAQKVVRPEVKMSSPFTFDPESNASQVIWQGMDPNSMSSARIVATTYPVGNIPNARLFQVEVPAPVGSAMGRNWVEASPEFAARVLSNVLLAHALGVPSSMTRPE